MSIHIVALGSERSGLGLLEEGAGQPQGGLLWSYLGRSVVPGVRDTLSRTDGSLLSSTAATLHPMNPAFIQYQARMFGDVRVLVHDCPSWDLLDRDWVATRGVLEQADILVIKYSVNDKLTFQQVRDAYSPRIRPLLRHWAVPVIVAAVGARLNEEGPPCTCPLCASDWSSSVPHNEGLQLARDLGATYLELPSLNDFFVGRYFGGVLEYFMVQCLKQKAKERPDKRRTHKASELRPPQLEQPARLPAVRVEESRFSQDMQWLLERGVQFADVAFYAGDSGKELGWAHAAVLCSVSPYFRQLLLGGQGRDRPVSRCACRDGPQSLLSTWDGGAEDPPRPDGHLAGRLSRLVVKDPLLCRCLWDMLRFLYRGASEWKQLQDAAGEKLKSSVAVAELLERVRSFITREKGSRETLSTHPSQQSSRYLGNLFNSPLCSDVIFMVQGSVLPAHRAVLVARCDVMAAMFSGKYAEARSRVVPIHGVSSDTFLSFLEYLYTDTCCPASVLQAMSVLVCAEMYQVKRLQHLCEVCVCAYLQSMPSRELASTGISVVRLLRRAKCHNADQLYIWLLHFIANNYLIFSHKPDFLELSGESRRPLQSKW
ncbi:rho-related BTB domain-containing protein 3 isoform X2 [Anguilla anguilla]|uniref:rho-related BTB domain-containing protein 3 isoform X2 n=1 Tax=Anguilla anguilla TaxID=7936 RepID=UPI0015B3770A|nr:rho-related BTB domain-containing protein 3 isoform X2 [Anguilla anguilla]XP_035247275.1 rho-related BTB domain-containing protein 3 isoform X2 [Anguilla anguilla]XP_035247277.1 rho-related BTB domain-containing protein 3 isoform X2 [Anguilla anguilla]XP_035247278.1 rho-related BTB domain-containing protein 3 isoform X2 [Anguilla anguilla]